MTEEQKRIVRGSVGMAVVFLAGVFLAAWLAACFGDWAYEADSTFAISTLEVLDGLFRILMFLCVAGVALFLWQAVKEANGDEEEE